MKNFLTKTILVFLFISILGLNLNAQTCANIYKKSSYYSTKYFGKILRAATILVDGNKLNLSNKIIKKSEKVIANFYNDHLKKANTTFIINEIIEPLHKFNMTGEELGLCHSKHRSQIYDPRDEGRWKHLIHYESCTSGYLPIADLLSVTKEKLFLIEEFMDIAKKAQTIRKEKEEKFKIQALQEDKNPKTVMITREEYQPLLESSKLYTIDEKSNKEKDFRGHSGSF